MADTGSSIEAFVESAIDAFELAGPLYQFGSCPNGASGPWARLRGSLPEEVCVGFGWEKEAKTARLPIPDGVARTVLCADVLGCIFEPRRAVDEMVRILSPGGALLIHASGTAAETGREPAHWRLTPRGLEQLLSGIEARLVAWQGEEGLPHTLYGIGFKPPLGDAVLSGTNRFLDRFPARLDQLAKRIGWRRRLGQLLAGGLSSQPERPRRRDYYKLRFAVHFSVDHKLKDELPQSCVPSKQTGTRLDLTE